MRQPTLPWAAPAHDAAPSPFDAGQQHVVHAHYRSEQHQQQTLELQLDPALFLSSPPTATNPDQLNEMPIPDKILQDTDATAASWPSSCAVTPSASILASTPQADASLAIEANALSSAEMSTPAVTAAPASECISRPPPRVHPFFQPGGPSSQSTDSNDDSDTEQKRRARSSRAKPPVSYREDLKAVLRADRAQEAARRKEEKRQAKLQAREAAKVPKVPKQPRQSKTDEPCLSDAQRTGAFELFESYSHASIDKDEHQSATASNAQASRSCTPPSSTRSQHPSKQVEPKPTSLAVKRSSTATSAIPHPFFAKKPKQPSAPPIHVAGEGGDDGKTGPPHHANGQVKASATASNSLFNSAPASWSLFATQRTSSSKPKKPRNAPWPTQQDMHVAGLADDENELLSKARSNLVAFRSRWQSRSSSPSPRKSHDPPPTDFVTQMNRTRPQPPLNGITLTGSAEFGCTDDFVRQAKMERVSPLAAALVGKQAESCRSSGQMWTDAFRPHLSCACVGNETAACYLLDWLRRLLVAAPGSVTTSDHKRKHAVQRRVDRTKRRRARRGYSDDNDSDGLGDFIVDDDADDDDDDDDVIGEYDQSIANDEWFGRFAKIHRTCSLTDDESVDEVKSSQATLASASTSASASSAPATSQSEEYASRHAFHTVHPKEYASLDRLTNCMILTGPSGSGKTASVYACAVELGYEVFELYPGMGKRSGKELLAAVGDLGRNHMVASGGVGGGATFRRPHPCTSAACTAGVGSNAASPAIRQSLILIEEADVLFEEDKGFWAAVVELVAESKRPVVVVCNELDLVPVHDLPVQQVLEYVKPGLEKGVVPWLQTVAAQMGRFVRADVIEAMVYDLPGTEAALDAQGEATADLRQALTQMQFGHLACTTRRISYEEAQKRAFSESQAAKQASMKAVASAAESSSLADVLETCLGRQDAEEFGDAGVDVQASSRQWGSWVQLVAQPLARHQQRQALAPSGEVEYRSTLAELHARLGVAGMASIVTSDGVHQIGQVRMTRTLLNTLQRRQAARLHGLVAPLLTHNCSCSLLPDSLVIDYAPIVRLMAMIDEDLASIHASLQHESQALESRGEHLQSPATMSARRSTRNSSRALTSWLGTHHDYAYERWLAALGPREVELAKLTSLVF